MADGSRELAQRIWDVLNAKGSGDREQRVFMPFEEIERHLHSQAGGTPNLWAEGFAAQHGLAVTPGDGGVWFSPPD